MRLYSPVVGLRQSYSHSMQSHCNQFRGGSAQSMALWNCSHSQSGPYHVNSGLVDCSINKNIKSSHPESVKYFVSLIGQQFRCGLSAREGSLSIKLEMPSREKVSRIGWNWRGMHQKIGGAAAGLCFGFSVTGLASVEVPVDRNIDNTQTSSSSTSSTHGKKVYTDYSITGIPGDGRCLFRSVIHGACLRSGRPIPNEDLQRKLADELRAVVADEFVKRREETEWFVEGDFDTYVSHIRQPHVWGGEP
ncbi:hypothetical protein ACP70R_000618 [Stipagrostis hirtigluma subsp. patula]